MQIKIEQQQVEIADAQIVAAVCSIIGKKYNVEQCFEEKGEKIKIVRLDKHHVCTLQMGLITEEEQHALEVIKFLNKL